jgi:hypothetical protein
MTLRMASCGLVVAMAVAPACAQSVRPGYLFTYFVGNGEDGLHLAWSSDGYKWQALDEGKSFLKPEVGESRLMRDPCVLRAPDGTFHMVWTTAWEGKTIGYASSKDLKTWSPQKAIPVMAHEPEVRNCWAPELAYDARRQEFLIFWASTIKGRFPATAGSSESDYNHRMYCTTTKDFVDFTPTRLFYDPGFSVIDATVLAANGRFHLIVKDETLKPPKKHLRIASSDSVGGPWSDLAPPFTPEGRWSEGPTAVRVGEEVVVFYDAYQEGRYCASSSKDLKTWEDVTAKMSFVKGMRHGTVIAVSADILSGLGVKGGLQ